MRATPEDKKLGMTVRSLRLKQGLTQQVLADGLGISFQQFQKYENGKDRISAMTLVKIAELLKQSPAMLLESAGQRILRHDDNPNDPSGTSEGRELVKLTRAFMKIKGRDQRKQIIELVEALAGGKRQKTS